MITIITGSRSWNDAAYIYRILDFIRWCHTVDQLAPEVMTIRHGAAGGADVISATWANTRHDRLVNQDPFPVPREEWRRVGARAGNLRNLRMIDKGGAELCIAFSRDGSNGTAHCVEAARRHSIPVWFHPYGYPALPPPAGCRLVTPQRWEEWINAPAQTL